MTQAISMKHFLRQLLSIISYYSGFCLFSEGIGKNHGARILCFHGINDNPSDQYTVSTTDFLMQMRFLAENFQVVPVDKLVSLLQNGQLIPSNTIALTIDDGFRDFYKHAFPILQRFDIPATVFLPVGFIDKKLKFENKLSQNEFLSWGQIREMHQKGIDFGSHTVSHPSLPQLQQDEIRYELQYSKERIASELGDLVNGFAYPYGTFRHVTSSIKKLVVSSGYSWAVTTISGVNKSRSDPFVLRRTVIVREDGLGGFKRALRGALDAWIGIQRSGYYLDKIIGVTRRQT